MATATDKAALTSAFVAYRKIPPSEVVGTDPESVYYAYVPSTRTYWGFARFNPIPDPSLDTQVKMQDGGSTGVFTKPAGGSWTMIAIGGEPYCPSQWSIPAALLSLWGLVDQSYCGSMG